MLTLQVEHLVGQMKEVVTHFCLTGIEGWIDMCVCLGKGEQWTQAGDADNTD